MGRGPYHHPKGKPGDPPGARTLPRVLAVAALIALLPPPHGEAQPRPTPAGGPVFPVAFSVARVDGSPVVDEAWLDAQIDQANRIFASADQRFERTAVHALDADHTRMETRRDRHRLGAAMRPGVINAFVVESLRDVDDPSRYRMGVHWRPAGRPGKHFVILSASASPTVLAHELGHFFGNRQHSDTPGNIMSYHRGDGLPFFDDAQRRRIGRSARRFLRTGEIAPVSLSAASGPSRGEL